MPREGETVTSRHCEPTGRANARPMTGSAKQSMTLREERMDCFVASLLAMTRLSLQLMPRHAPVGFEIALAGRIDHAGRQRRRRAVAVPAPGFPLGVEIVAQRLLVEARLALAGLVDVDGPEPRTVRCHHFVDQNDAAVTVAAEFELGVGDDDALLAGG